MKAVYSLWTNPSSLPEDFELLSLILSTLKWHEKNGEADMVTDSIGMRFFRDMGLDDIWSNTSVFLDNIPDSLDSKTYWAAGKIYALSRYSTPIVGIDADFIVWNTIDFNLLNCSAAAIHSEPLSDISYPDYEAFLSFAPELSFSVSPVNTAFTFVNNDEFLKFYCNTSIDFMLSHIPERNPLAYMLFAEQRLFSMCAEKLGFSVHTFSDLDKLFNQKNKTFTHLWGAKQQIRSNPEMRKVFCTRLKNRIISDYPYMRQTICRIYPE